MKKLALLLLLLPGVTAARADVLHLVLDDTIHPVAEEYVGRGLDEAARMHADAVVLELRTPGGLETSMRVIVKKIIASKVPVLVWVGPSGSRAASAGFFILEAADVASMAPGTNTGAAHPVLIGQKIDDVMKLKMQNDAAAFIRSLAQHRARNVAAAESGVREAKSFTENEALSQHLIEVVAADVPSLLRWADGKTIKRFDGTSAVLHVAHKRLAPYDMTVKQRVLSWLMDPNIAFILFAIGFLALWSEFSHPGAIVPGVAGFVSILLAVFALNLLPTRYAAFGLILGAFILFGLEAKFVSHGLLGAGGIVCLVFGGLLLVDGPIPEMQVQLVTALAVSVPIGLIAIFLMSLVMRSRKHRLANGPDAMVGEIGVAQTLVGPDGKVFVHGELWNARSQNEIAEGSRVRVRGVEGLRVIVERAD